MTRDQAEEIWMANQVGMFNGPRSELAMAVLILSDDEADDEIADNEWAGGPLCTGSFPIENEE